MKRFAVLFFGLFLLLFTREVSAQTSGEYFYQYVITNFDSQIDVEKDTSLSVKETIVVNFPDQRHGIFRTIPVVYSARGKTIRAGFKVLSVEDQFGSPYRYKQARQGHYVELKIGDPDKTVTGLNTYIITYKISKVIQRFDDSDEVYWNVTGSEWDTDILKASAIVNSPDAEITKIDCFAGAYGGNDKFCRQNFNQNTANFYSTTGLGYGHDFTIVVALDKNSNLVFPGFLQKTVELILDNWGYVVALLPFSVILYFWLKKGRDKRFIGESVYYDQGKGVMTKPLFAREYLPTVYYPIQELSPAEVGTIVDTKVDIDDVIAEIVELARLGFMKIEKLEKKALFVKSKDYGFTRLDKDISNLSEYQLDLLENLFDEDSVAATVKELEKVFKTDSSKFKEVLKLTAEDKYELLSALKNRFYKHLEEFKEKLYKSLAADGIFDGAPDKVRTKWLVVFSLTEGLAVALLIYFFNATYNFFPFFAFGLLSIPGFLLAFSMPRRTARGYSFYRQIKGLSFYLAKGKWREEVAEKHLFFGEMLPLAMALGIVDKLANDMQGLGVKPPDYFTGVATYSLASDMRGFSSSASSSLVSAPGGKGGSWSGGSGFSGGSGGGFGGGGGGSW